MTLTGTLLPSSYETEKIKLQKEQAKFEARQNAFFSENRARMEVWRGPPLLHIHKRRHLGGCGVKLWLLLLIM